MHADEHHLEAADEKTQRQQPEPRVGAGFAQRFAQALLMGQDRRRAIFDHRRQGHDQGYQQAQGEQGNGPAEPADQAQGTRQHGELTERAGRRRDAHGHAALLRGHGAAHHAEDHRERGAGQADADQQAGTQ
ncbi:hypothetical protein D3C85_1477360 [compost metagenome]